MKIELIRREGIVVTLKVWSDKLHYFEVTHEVKQPGSIWTDCRVMVRSQSVYNLKLIHKLLPGETYSKFIFWRAERLWKKAKRKLEEEK